MVDTDVAELTKVLAHQGVPVDFAAVLAQLDEDIRKGSEDRTADTTEWITG